MSAFARFASACALVVGACVQSDVVAREAWSTVTTCPAGQCACAASTCPDLDATQGDFCRGEGFASLTGNACREEAAPAYVYAACSCTDLSLGGALVVDAFSGSPEQLRAGVAHVGANGDLSSSETLSVSGLVDVAGAVNTESNAVALRSVTDTPCRCDSTLDIEGVVSAHRNDNDDATLGLEADALDGATGDKSLSLGCGRYFLSRIAVGGNLTLEVTGRVVLWVETNLELDGAFRVNVAQGGSLELWVGGTVRASGPVTLGDESRGQDSFRMLVGGQGTVDLRANALIAGVLYAPTAELVSAADVTIYGALFVRRVASEGALTIHYDTSLEAPEACGG